MQPSEQDGRNSGTHDLAKMNAGASSVLIPANVSVTDRASVTAGFANDVEAANQ
jgi:hypothetical protein